MRSGGSAQIRSVKNAPNGWQAVGNLTQAFPVTGIAPQLVEKTNRTTNDRQNFMMRTAPYESVDSNPTPSCLCDPWRKKIVSTDTQTYTDADLAADMNTLTFEERQAMEEDIHGVSDVVPETEEFVATKMNRMVEALAKLSSRERQAWDRAVFLRPALAQDRKLHLMCLRARRFRTLEAAKLLAAYFRAKRDLFGDELLVHRITWQDVRILVEYTL